MPVDAPTQTRMYQGVTINTTVQLGDNFVRFAATFADLVIRFIQTDRKRLSLSYPSLRDLFGTVANNPDLTAKYPLLSKVSPQLIDRAEKYYNKLRTTQADNPVGYFLRELSDRYIRGMVQSYFPSDFIVSITYIFWLIIVLGRVDLIVDFIVDDVPFPDTPAITGLILDRPNDKTLNALAEDSFMDVNTLQPVDQANIKRFLSGKTPLKVAATTTGAGPSGVSQVGVQDKTDFKVFDSAQRFSAMILDTIFSYANVTISSEDDYRRILINFTKTINDRIKEFSTDASVDFCSVFDSATASERISIQELGGTKGGTSAGVGPLVYAKSDDLARVVQGNIDQLDISLPLDGSFVPVTVKIIAKSVNDTFNVVQKQNFVYVQSQSNIPGVDYNTAITGVPYGTLYNKKGDALVQPGQYFRIVGKDSKGQYMWAESAPAYGRYVFDPATNAYTFTSNNVNNADVLYLDNWEPPFRTSGNYATINLGDPSHEVFVSTVIGNYYDAGVLPFVNKFYGYFICPPTKSYVISARTSFDFTKILSAVDCREVSGGVLQSKPNQSYLGYWTLPSTVTDRKVAYRNILLGLVSQAMFTFDFLKQKLYLAHYDTWNNNLMATYTHNKLIKIPGQSVIPTIYQGKKMDEVTWFDIRVVDPRNPSAPRRRLLVQNMGLLFKLIDFGQTSIQFRFPNGKIFDVNHEANLNGGDRAREITSTNESAFNSMEMIYILINIFDDYTRHQGFSETDPVVQMIFTLLDGVVDNSVNKPVVDLLRSGVKVYSPTNAVTTNGYVVSDDGAAYLKREWFPCHSPNRDGKITSLAYPDPGNATLISGVSVKRRDTVDVNNFQSFNSWWDRLFGLLGALGMTTRIPGDFAESSRSVTVQNETVYYISLDGSIPTTPAPDSPYVGPTILVGTNDSVTTRNALKTPFLNFYQNMKVMSTVCDNPAVDAAGTKAYLQRYIRGLSPNVSAIDPSSADAKNKICSTTKTYNVTPNSPEVMMKKMITGENPLNAYKDDGTLSQEVLSNTVRGGTPSLPPHKVIGSLSCFTLSVTPALKPMTGITSPGGLNLVKYPYQEWFNYAPPPGVGEYINDVRIHINRIVNPNGYLRLNQPLLEAGLEALNNTPNSNNFFTNGGYFIVPYNVQDPLNAGKLTEQDYGKPIGYTYTRENGAILALDVPYPYKFDMGTVVFGKDGSVKIYNTLEFENMHTLEQKPLSIALMNGQMVTLDVPTIKVSPNPTLRDGSEVFYNYAFTSGPVLVKDGRVVFTKSKMLNSQFVAKDGTLLMEESDTKYPPDYQFKVTGYAKTNSAYRANYDPTGRNTDSVFPWGQRHSNQFINHNVLATLDDGSVVTFLVEGRGFDAAGIDRSQLAEIVALFGVKDAVSLDGGFSAQGLIKEEGVAYYILNDPDKRSVGVVVSFVV